jgi:hypothetical protein
VGGVGDQSSGDAPGNKTYLKDSSHRIYMTTAWGTFIGIAAFLTASCLFVCGWMLIQKTINDTVDKKLNDEAVLRKFAGQLRPTLIFDSHSSIIEDWGTAQFLVGNIQISTNGSGWPDTVHIDFNKHLTSAPILTTMYDSASVIPRRGTGFSWDFTIHFFIQPSLNEDKLYRLELAP